MTGLMNFQTTLGINTFRNKTFWEITYQNINLSPFLHKKKNAYVLYTEVN